MTPKLAHPSLLGLKVFLAEDEALVSVMLETMLAEFGCIVTGVGASVAQALSQVETIHVIDVAILDVHLGGETVFPVADVLRQRHVPFVFSTGFGPADLAERYPDSPLLNKPYGPDALADVLAGFRGSAA